MQPSKSISSAANPSVTDAIVVGSGAGGSAAAAALVRGGCRVLLLERGAELPRDGSTLDIRRVVHAGEFRSREPWRDGAGRPIVPEEYFNVGGKTRWYGAALLRFAPHEFNPEARHQCLGWPFGPAELSPWYEAAEQALSVRHFECEPALARILQRVTSQRAGWRVEPLPLALAAEVLTEPLEARRFDGFASVAGLKGEAHSALLAPLAGDGRLRLLTGARVSRLDGAPGAPRRITGVRLADGRRFSAPAIILSAGALHSPRLLRDYLMASGAADELPCAELVGRYLKLHLLTAVVAVSPGRKSDLLRKTQLLLSERLPHSSVQPLGFDAELISTLLPGLVPSRLAGAIGARAYGFFLQTEDGSHAANRVLGAVPGLTGSLPVLDYDAQRLPPALLEHRRLVRAFRVSLARAGLLAFAQRIGVTGTAHACGTLVAGSDPARSVVDGEGAVHGMQGLYVADGSVLPRSSRVNPSLTIYAWGLRLGARLAARLAPPARQGQREPLPA